MKFTAFQQIKHSNISTNQVKSFFFFGEKSMFHYKNTFIKQRKMDENLKIKTSPPCFISHFNLLLLKEKELKEISLLKIIINFRNKNLNLVEQRRIAKERI